MLDGGVGDVSDRELLMVGILSRDDLGVRGQHEVGRLILQTCLECDSIHHVSEGEVFVCEVCGYEHLGELANELTALAPKLTKRQAVCPWGSKRQHLDARCDSLQTRTRRWMRRA